MKEINISCYSNKRVRTLIRFFNHIFINSIQPDINMAEEFVDRYIPETKKFILGHLSMIFDAKWQNSA